MGHEASGEIVCVGEGVGGWKLGDRVTFDSTVYRLDDWYTLRGSYNLSEGREVIGVSPGDYCRPGAFAEYISVPQHILYRIPEGVSFVQAAMVEPAAVAAHAVGLSGVCLGASSVVIGVGMIGTFIVRMLRLSGSTPVIAVDTVDGKLAMSSRYGADVLINADRESVSDVVRLHTNGRGADVGLEAVGISSTVNLLISSLRRGGTGVLVGNVTPSIDFPLQRVVTSELRIQGSCAINGEYATVLSLLASGSLSVDGMISATAPLSEGSEWFTRLSAGTEKLNKIILIP
jgi:L-iditol 2-dehydrogenase